MKKYSLFTKYRWFAEINIISATHLQFLCSPEKQKIKNKIPPKPSFEKKKINENLTINLLWPNQILTEK